VILAAGLLVLLGLGLFVAGVLSGVTALYWACVAVCVVAAVLLFVARKRLAAPAAPGTGEPAATEAPATRAAATEPEHLTEAPASETTPPAAAGATAASVAPPAVVEDLPDPPVEEVEVTDLLIVVDLTDEVVVLDEHPRYHLAECPHVVGRTPIPLPLDEARTDGFTPCAVCAPDRTLAQRARDRKAAKG